VIECRFNVDTHPCRQCDVYALPILCNNQNQQKEDVSREFGAAYAVEHAPRSQEFGASPRAAVDAPKK